MNKTKNADGALLDHLQLWLTMHHGPDDAHHLLDFFNGDCQHPYLEPDGTCDLCDG